MKECVKEIPHELTVELLKCLYEKAFEIGDDQWDFNFSSEVDYECSDEDFEEESDECFEYFTNDRKELFMHTIDRIRNVAEGAPIYRSIKVPYEFSEEMYTKDGLELGESWSVSREKTQKFIDREMVREGVPVILRTVLTKDKALDSIDLDNTIMLGLIFDEGEIRLKKGSPITLSYYGAEYKHEV